MYKHHDESRSEGLVFPGGHRPSLRCCTPALLRVLWDGRVGMGVPRLTTRRVAHT